MLVRSLLPLAVLGFSPILAVAELDYRRRDFRTLTNRQVEGIAKLDPPEWESVTSGHLENLLIPRVSGTQNNTNVQQYISSVFAKLGWNEEKYAKHMTTPHGEVEFTNLVYTFDADAPRKLVLSAHFDSKWFKQGGFIGATDSAAPCATLIDVAEALTPLLAQRRKRMLAGTPLLTAEVDETEAAEVTLQIIFFDGEEAFENWTQEDSVYGSRILAETWEDTLLPDHHPLAKRRMGPIPNVLDSMDVLVLLDLLGAAKPRMRSFFPETRWLFDELAAADTKLKAAKLVDGTDPTWFSQVPGHPGMVDDDHRPFLQRGVPVLHLIPLPFPDVWHNMGDNADALDLPTLRRWNRIMRVFTAGYLGLSPEDAGDAAPKKPTPKPNPDPQAQGRAGHLASEEVRRSELVRAD